MASTIEKKTSFERMKSDRFSNLKEIAQLEDFFRKGEIGSWKGQFTVAQSEYFDLVYEKRILDSGLDFEFE